MLVYLVGKNLATSSCALNSSPCNLLYVLTSLLDHKGVLVRNLKWLQFCASGLSASGTHGFHCSFVVCSFCRCLWSSTKECLWRVRHVASLIWIISTCREHWTIHILFNKNPTCLHIFKTQLNVRPVNSIIAILPGVRFTATYNTNIHTTPVFNFCIMCTFKSIE